MVSNGSFFFTAPIFRDSQAERRVGHCKLHAGLGGDASSALGYLEESSRADGRSHDHDVVLGQKRNNESATRSRRLPGQEYPAATNPSCPGRPL
jgi:hypothetical protein